MESVVEEDGKEEIWKMSRQPRFLFGRRSICAVRNVREWYARLTDSHACSDDGYFNPIIIRRLNRPTVMAIPVLQLNK
jgi:hypothetical protein